jgi:hypothetical protein
VHQHLGVRHLALYAAASLKGAIRSFAAHHISDLLLNASYLLQVLCYRAYITPRRPVSTPENPKPRPSLVQLWKLSRVRKFAHSFPLFLGWDATSFRLLRGFRVHFMGKSFALHSVILCSPWLVDIEFPLGQVREMRLNPFMKFCCTSTQFPEVPLSAAFEIQVLACSGGRPIVLYLPLFLLFRT